MKSVVSQAEPLQRSFGIATLNNVMRGKEDSKRPSSDNIVAINSLVGSNELGKGASIGMTGMAD